MYSTSLTHLGNLSGYYNDSNSVYGAEFNEVKALTPYYERVVHYIDQKPWKHPYMESTYLNYYKAMNEAPIVTYKELEFKAISEDNHELVEGFNDIGKYSSCSSGTCGRNRIDNNIGNNLNITSIRNSDKNGNSNKNIIDKNYDENIDENMDTTLNENVDNMSEQGLSVQNPYAKSLLILFLLFTIFLIIKYSN
jgi:hypothetical protein